MSRLLYKKGHSEEVKYSTKVKIRDQYTISHIQFVIGIRSNVS